MRSKLKLSAFLAGHIVAMVTYCSTNLTTHIEDGGFGPPPEIDLHLALLEAERFSQGGPKRPIFYVCVKNMV